MTLLTAAVRADAASSDKMERLANASSTSTGSLGGGAASKESRVGTPRAAAAAAAAARSMFGGPRKSADLWRDSTAVSVAASELGYRSVRELAGSAFIPNSRLRVLRQLGEGAYAGKPPRRRPGAALSSESC